MRPIRLLAMFWVVCVASLAAAQPTFSGLTYATVGGQPLLLDLYLPSGTAPPRPLVIWIHGGGWAGGSRFPAGGAPALVQQGFAVASIDYRLTSQAGQFGGESVTFPAQIHDVKGAIRWLRANAAQYNLDHTRFGVWGSSAGGHLVALAATSGGVAAIEGTVGGNLAYWSGVQAAGDYFGPTDLLQMNLDVTTPPGSVIDHDAYNSPESRLIGFDQPGQGIGELRANFTNPAAPFPHYATLVTQANPITWVDASDPPMFIAHGDSDTLVPWRQSLRLHNALDAVGVFNDYRIIAGAGHGNLGGGTTQGTHGFFAAKLGALPMCAGDVNGDRLVNFADLNLVLSSFGASGAVLVGDLNRDGVVNFADLNLVLSGFGGPC